MATLRRRCVHDDALHTARSTAHPEPNAPDTVVHDANEPEASPATGGGWIRVPQIAQLKAVVPLAGALASSAAGYVVGAAAGAARAVGRGKTDSGPAVSCVDCGVAFGMRVWKYPCPHCARLCCAACLPATRRHTSFTDAGPTVCAACFIVEVRHLATSPSVIYFSPVGCACLHAACVRVNMCGPICLWPFLHP